MKHGIDISSYNTVVWKRLDPRIEFVIVKATQGIGYTDSKLIAHSYYVKECGRKIGYYHFATLNNKDVKADALREAQDFCKSILNLPLADLPHALDLEVDEYNLSREDVELWAQTWFDEVTRITGHECMLYSGLYFLSIHLLPTHKLGKYKLWLAGDVRYHTTVSLDNAERYRVPAPPVGWKSIYIWQYSDMGKPAGIVGAVDANIMLN